MPLHQGAAFPFFSEAVIPKEEEDAALLRVPESQGSCWCHEVNLNGLLDPDSYDRLFSPVIQNGRVFPEKIVRIAPNAISKLGGREDGKVPREGRRCWSGCEDGGRRRGHHDLGQLHSRSRTVHGGSPGRYGDQGGHRYHRYQGGPTTEGLPGDGRAIFQVEDPVVQPRPEIRRNVQSGQSSKEIPTDFIGLGVPSARFTCPAMGLHVFDDRGLGPSVEKVGEKRQKLLTVHRV
jgi:hypothetical protein